MATCTACGGEIFWKQRDGRWHGENADGSDHWDLCSQRKLEFFKEHGKEFAGKVGNERVRGLELQHGRELNGKRVQLLERAPLKPITGKNFKVNGCTCGLPPWALCKPDCEHGIGVRL